MRMVRIPLVVLAGLAVAPSVAPLAAQGATYTSTTKFNAAGALGTIIKMAGGGGSSSTTTYVSGHKLRTDARDNSTIIDVDGGRFIFIDNKQKGYGVMTFEQMAMAMDSAARAAKAEQAKEPKQPKQKSAMDSIQMDYSVKVDNTGEQEKIAGYDASREFITLTMGAHQKGQEARSDEGNIVVLMDIWKSTDAPSAAAMKEFQRAYAARMKHDFQAPMRSMAALFSTNPNMKTAFEAAGKEMAKLPGVPLRSTTYFVGVPEGMTFDRSQVIGGANAGAAQGASAEPPKKSGGLFGKLKAAAAAAEQKSAGENKGAPKQGTLMSFTTEVTDMRTGVPANAFSIPAGYREAPNGMNYR